jgi:adenosylcobinamide kinase / adenosylcobinamide-phosphate guanylyltransferase
MSLILVTGGARAGKSTFAEQLARQLGGDQGVCYLATAEPGDEEMRARIAVHQASRPAGWRTIEVPRNLRNALSALQPPTVRVVLLDCLTLLVSNLLLAHPDRAGAEDVWPSVQAEIDDLIRFAAQPAVTTLVVTNEVGLGVVPATRPGRIYRDLLGRANQRLAAAAAFVYLVVSGVPLEIKGMQRPINPLPGERT